jgi:hypothetical protein
LRKISDCDPSTTILGHRSAIPIFVSGAALAKLGHPLGEANIANGAGQTGIVQMVSSNASLSFAEIAAARTSPDQIQFFQLYKHKDNSVALQRIREVEQLGYKAIFLTVDAPVPGNRERDARASWEVEELEAAAEEGGKSNAEMPMTSKKMEDVEEDVDTGGTAGGLLANDDIDMTWDEVRRTPVWGQSLPLTMVHRRFHGCAASQSYRLSSRVYSASRYASCLICFHTLTMCRTPSWLPKLASMEFCCLITEVGLYIIWYILPIPLSHIYFSGRQMP